MRSELTAERLRQMLRYEPDTGQFFWLCRSGSKGTTGVLAGTLDTDGYIRIGLDRGIYRAHRLVWLHTTGHWPAGEIDHRDGNRQNNRLSNLREVSRAANQQNLRTANRRNTSGTLGVSLHQATGKWRARIWVGGKNGKNKSLGLFDSKSAAQERYVQAKRELHEGNTL